MPNTGTRPHYSEAFVCPALTLGLGPKIGLKHSKCTFNTIIFKDSKFYIFIQGESKIMSSLERM